MKAIVFSDNLYVVFANLAPLLLGLIWMNATL